MTVYGCEITGVNAVVNSENRNPLPEEVGRGYETHSGGENRRRKMEDKPPAVKR